MEFNVAGLTTMLLGFTLGYQLVLSLIEKPVLPLIGSPEKLPAHEADIRGVHAILRTLQYYAGTKVILPVMTLTLGMGVWQAYSRQFDAMSMFVLIGLIAVAYLVIVRVAPLAARLHKSSSQAIDLEDLSLQLFRVVRLHNKLFVAVFTVTLAQATLLFL